jgi:hypothetical protein
MASAVAAGPAKKAAGSPGRARVSKKVTIITPITLGMAPRRRCPMILIVEEDMGGKRVDG